MINLGVLVRAAALVHSAPNKLINVARRSVLKTSAARIVLVNDNYVQKYNVYDNLQFFYLAHKPII